MKLRLPLGYVQSMTTCLLNNPSLTPDEHHASFDSKEPANPKLHPPHVTLLKGFQRRGLNRERTLGLIGDTFTAANLQQEVSYTPSGWLWAREILSRYLVVRSSFSCTGIIDDSTQYDRGFRRIRRNWMLCTCINMYRLL
jgi:hypothetical protein